MANEKRTQKEYDEKMIEFIKKDKEIKKRQRSISYMFKTDKDLQTKINERSNLEEEIENILNRTEDCVVKKKIITKKGKFFSSSTKDPNFERMENMIDNEKYQVYDRSKTLLGKGKERGKSKKEYNYGYKNLYDFNTAFKVFQSEMMRDEKGIIVDFKDNEGESVFETQIYKEGVPFFYADIIRIALLENDMETLKETVVFLEKQILNNTGYDDESRNDIAPIELQKQLQNPESDLSKQYEIAKAKVKKINDAEYKEIEERYRQKINFAYFVTRKAAEESLKESKKIGLQQGFILDINDWEKIQDDKPKEIKIDKNLLDKIVETILRDSKVRVQKNKDKIYDKNHIELKEVSIVTNLTMYMRWVKSQNTKDKKIEKSTENTIKLMKLKKELYKDTFNIVKAMEYYKNSGYVSKLRQELVDDMVMWARKNMSVYNILKNEHKKCIEKLKIYGRVKNSRPGIFVNRRGKLQSKSNRKQIIEDELEGGTMEGGTMEGGSVWGEAIHRPTTLVEGESEFNETSILTDLPFYDITSDKLLNIEQFLGVYDKPVTGKKIDTPLSEYGKVVLDYKTKSISNVDDQEPWSTPNDSTTFNYSLLPKEIQDVMEFWRRDYEEEQAVIFSGENADNGKDRRINLLRKQKNSCDQLLEWENENFKQVISEQGNKCLEKESNKKLALISKGKGDEICNDFNMMYNSTSSKNYKSQLNKLLMNIDKCANENIYKDALTPTGETDVDGDKSVSVDEDETAVKITSRDLGTQGELTFRVLYDKNKASADMMGDIGTDNTYYWENISDVMKQLESTKPETKSDVKIKTDGPPEVAQGTTTEKKTDEDAAKSKADEDAAKSKADEDAAKLKADEDAAKLKAENDKTITDLEEQLKKQNITEEDKKKLQEQLNKAVEEKTEINNKLGETEVEKEQLVVKNAQLLEEKARVSTELLGERAKQESNKEEKEKLEQALAKAKELEDAAKKQVEEAKQEAANSKLEQEKLQQLTEDLKTANETEKKKLEEQIQQKTAELEENIKTAESKQADLEKKFEDEKQNLSSEMQKKIDTAETERDREKEARSYAEADKISAEADKISAEAEAKRQTQIAARGRTLKGIGQNLVSRIKGGSKKRKYSFKKLPKRKRRNNKSNKTQAKKRGKRLNRTKKMSR